MATNPPPATDKYRQSPTDKDAGCPDGYRRDADGKCIPRAELQRNRAAVDQATSTGADIAEGQASQEREHMRSLGIDRPETQASPVSATSKYAQPVGQIKMQPLRLDDEVTATVEAEPRETPRTDDTSRDLLDAFGGGRLPPEPLQPPREEEEVRPERSDPTSAIGPSRPGELERAQREEELIQRTGQDPEDTGPLGAAYRGFRQQLGGDLSVTGDILDQALETAEELKRHTENVVRRARGGAPITDADASRLTELLRRADSQFPKSQATGEFLGTTTGVIGDLAAFKGLSAAGGARVSGPIGELMRVMGRWSFPTHRQGALVGAAEEIPIQAGRMLAGGDVSAGEALTGAGIGAAAAGAFPGVGQFRRIQDAVEAGRSASARTLRGVTDRVPDVLQRPEGALEVAAREEAEQAIGTAGRTVDPTSLEARQERAPVAPGELDVTYKGEAGIEEFSIGDELPFVGETAKYAPEAPEQSIHRFGLRSGDTEVDMTAWVDHTQRHVDIDIPRMLAEGDEGAIGHRAVRDAARSVVRQFDEMGVEINTVGGFRNLGINPGREMKISADRFRNQAEPLTISRQRLRDDPRAGHLLLPDLSGIPRYAREGIRRTRRQGQRLSEAEFHVPLLERRGDKTSIRREFMSQGDLPDEAFRAKIKQDAWTRAAVRRGEYLLREWDRSVKDVLKESERYAISSADDIDTMLNTTLIAEGRQPMETLPEPLRPVAMEMRDFVDTLSQKFIDDGVVQGPMAAVVEANKGVYLNRAYRVHVDPNWVYDKIPDEIRNRAVSFLRTQDAYKDLTEDQMETALRRILETERDSPFFSATTLGSKDLSVLKKRMLDSRPIRELLGEITEGRQNFARSVLKMTRLVGNHNLLTELKTTGLRSGFFSKKEGFVPGHTVPIAAEGSDTLFPLNGLYTTPQVARAFRDAIDPDLEDWVAPMLMKAIGGVKYGKTVLSFQTHVRNFVSASGFAIANGHLFKRDGLKIFQDLKVAQGSVKADLGWLGAGRGTAADPSTAGSADVARQMDEARGMGVEPRREWFDTDDVSREDIVELAVNGGLDVGNPSHMLTLMNRLQELGVTFEAVRAGELGDVMRAAVKSDDPLQHFQGYLGGPVKGAMNVAQGAYRAEDDFWKVFSFLGEYRRYRDAFGPEMTNVDVEEYTANLIRNQIPTYSLVPRIVHRMKKNPLIAPFASFSAEIIRTSTNLLRQTWGEIHSSNPEIQKIGVERAIGILTASTATTGAAAGTAHAVGMSFQSEKDIREALPPWSRNSDIAWLGWDKDNGTAQYVDLSYTDPYNYLKRPIVAMLTNQDWESALVDSVVELGSPFFGPEILTGALWNTMTNKKPSGGSIWNPEDDSVTISKDIGNYLVDQLKPGTLNNLERIAKGYGWIKDENGREYDGHAEVIAMLSGMRVANIDFRDMLFFNGLRLRTKLPGANRRMRTEAFREGATEDDLTEAFEKSTESRRNLLQEYSQFIHTARVSGLSDREIREQMERARIPKTTQDDLLRGRFRAYAPDLSDAESFDIQRRQSTFDRLQLRARGDLEQRPGVENESTDSSTTPPSATSKYRN